jgi:(4S)-4-hydroxy-5-phosphonooxypentane-2,3-dione isomerase
MFVRIVKMSLQEDKVDAFLNNFEEVKQHIRNFPGNRFLELYRDRKDPNIFFTYSYWENEEALESYRSSDLFCGVWAFTKPLFKEKAQAWSVDKLVTLE